LDIDLIFRLDIKYSTFDIGLKKDQNLPSGSATLKLHPVAFYTSSRV